MDPVTYRYDALERIHVIRGDKPPVGADGEPTRKEGTDPPGGEVVESHVYTVDTPRPVRFEHDPKARVFRLTTADGTVEAWRDNPTRFLCVEPDPETGAMRPVTKRGRPVYIYLCREEREVR